MADVFISYSRQDQSFVRQLFGALEVAGQDAWVDWEDIPLTTDWWSEIREGIEEAKAFIFVMTPASLSSQVCTLEVSLALQLHKRIIPVLPNPFDTNDALEKLKARPVDSSLKALVGGRSLGDMASINWQTLSSINWVQFADRDFDMVTRQLLEVLQTDYDHAKTHTRLLQRALEWERANRVNTLLLRGDAQREAEAWVRYNADKLPKPSDIHREYIAAGIRLRMREVRQLRALVGTLVILLILALGAGVVAINRSQVAETEAAERAVQQALAEQNAAEAEENLRAQWLLQSLFLSGQSNLIRRDSGDPTSFINLSLESLSHYDEGIFRHESQIMLMEALNHPLQVEAELSDITHVIDMDTSADGSHYLVATQDSVYVWTPDDNGLVTLTATDTFAFPAAAAILDVAFVNQDTQVVVMTSDRTVLVTLDGSLDPISVQYEPYYSLHLAASGDWAWGTRQQEDSTFTIEAWAVDGSVHRTLSNVQMLQEAYFSPDYHYMTIPSFSDQTILWDLVTDTTRILKGASYTEVRWAGNDVVLIRDVQGTLRAFRVSTETPEQLFFIGRVVTAVPSPDGTKIAVINSDQTLRILRTEDGELEGEMLLFEANSSDIVWNAAQDHVMTWGRETILLWALADEFPQSISFLGGAFGLFTDTHALVAGDRSISVIALYGGNAETVAYPASPIIEMNWNSTTDHLVVRAGFASLRLWRAGKPPLPRLVPEDEVQPLVDILPCHPQILGDAVGENRPSQTACTSDLTLIAGVLADKGEIWVWSLDNPETPIATFNAAFSIRAMHFSPDNTHLAVIDDEVGGAFIYTVGQKNPVRIDSLVDGDSLRWTDDGTAVRFVHPYTRRTEEWTVDVKQLIQLAQAVVLRPLNEGERAAFFLDITEE